MWYKILCTAVPSIFMQNKKVYICFPELGAPKKIPIMSYGGIKIFHLLEFTSKLYILLLAGCLTYLILIHFEKYAL